MNIHFLLAKDFFRGGGIETYTREVGRRLVERGHNVTVYSTRGTGTCPDDFEGMRLIWLPRVKPYWAEKCSGALFAAWQAMRQETPDVMHLHSVVAGSMAPLLRLKGTRCVLQMHGIEWMRSRWGNVAKGLLRAMERASMSCADAITAVSRTQCDYYRDLYESDCEFIPTAADVKELAPADLIRKMGLQPGKYILFAARLVPEKGLHHLIQAFHKVATDLPLIIAGEAPTTSAYDQELRRLADGDARIRFIGRVHGRLLEELFSNAFLFTQPSEIEGLSIGLIEAMSYGLPCLASDIPENIEVVSDCGILFRNRDVTDLESQLRWALANRETALIMAARGRERVRQFFSWERVVDQLEALYQSVTVAHEGTQMVRPVS
ncbi:MAG: glycosyltransferase family 4 protein [Bryobacteraceae bacterium]